MGLRLVRLGRPLGVGVLLADDMLGNGIVPDNEPDCPMLLSGVSNVGACVPNELKAMLILGLRVNISVIRSATAAWRLIGVGRLSARGWIIYDIEYRISSRLIVQHIRK